MFRLLAVPPVHRNRQLLLGVVNGAVQQQVEHVFQTDLAEARRTGVLSHAQKMNKRLKQNNKKVMYYMYFKINYFDHWHVFKKIHVLQHPLVSVSM